MFNYICKKLNYFWKKIITGLFFLITRHYKLVVIFFFALAKKRYKIFNFPFTRDVKPTAKNCETIIRNFGIEDYEIGKNKVSVLNFKFELSM